MIARQKKSIFPNWFGGVDTAMFLWPLIGLGSVLGLAVIYNEVFWAGPLVNRIGYLVPAGVGCGCGILCALWFRCSQRHLYKSEVRSQQFEKLSRRYELILQSTGEGIYEVDQQGRCLFVNRAALEMLGYEESELLEKNVHNLVYDFSHADDSLLSSGSSTDSVAKHNIGIHIPDDIKVRKDGSTFIADTHAYPVIDGGVSSVVVMFRDATEERKLQKRIHHMANFDNLTGLQNRYSFEKSLQQAIVNVHEENRQHVLCYIDLDQFKIINDTAGHIAGDTMLQELSAELNRHIRKGDVLARLGGDEFGLLLHDCQLDGVHSVIQNLQKQINGFGFRWEGQPFKVGLSIGVCLLDTKIKDITHALKLADQACYMAKESGRNRYHIYSFADNEFQSMTAEMNWVVRINQALSDGRLFLRYQAIADLNGSENSPDRFEVLISMKDESGKTLPPGGFLPAAERYGLITAIDRWVVQTTFDWLERNVVKQPDIDFISINLSGKSFSDDAFLEFIQKELEKRSFSADKICFEITETAAMQQMNKALNFVQEIKKIGCRFALDDFGSGMASFGYLKRFPVDYIKIDGSFVQDIVNDPLSQAVVKSIYNVAQVMQVSTIAEHAEDQETLNVLKAIGIDYVQGYVIARPGILPIQ